ncbi:MAG: tyrosine/phenylalanine carboxypeptidase domain-containing protein [Polyangiaceae bacterium]
MGAWRLPVRVVVSRHLASLAAVGDGVVHVVAGRMLSERDVERTVRHEMLGHVLPRQRADGERLGLFAVGTAAGADDQEGRALFLEKQGGFLDVGRRRELALRHLAARRTQAGEGFVETTRGLLAHDATLPDALRIVARAHRGGGLAREAVYLPALLRVERALAARPALDAVLARGRVAVGAASLLAPWISTEEVPPREGVGRVRSPVGIASAG